jgi:hypothetical protein
MTNVLVVRGGCSHRCVQHGYALFLSVGGISHRNSDRFLLPPLDARASSENTQSNSTDGHATIICHCSFLEASYKNVHGLRTMIGVARRCGFAVVRAMG